MPDPVRELVAEARRYLATWTPTGPGLEDDLIRRLADALEARESDACRRLERAVRAEGESDGLRAAAERWRACIEVGGTR